MDKEITSKIVSLKAKVTQLENADEVLGKAVKERDLKLWSVFRQIASVARQLTKPANAAALKELEQAYGDLRTRSPEMLLIKLAMPNLSRQQRSKYAHAIAYIRNNKEKGVKVRDFLRDNGGINGCVESEKKERQQMARGIVKGLADDSDDSW